MSIQDVSAAVVARLYDLAREKTPLEIERLRRDELIESPDLPERAIRRRVVDRLVGGNVRRYRSLQELAQRSRAEPHGSSPLEQIKGRTSLLNEYGRVTGGNYRRM